MTAELAERRPDALVASRPESQTPSYRITINLRRLNVSTDGRATSKADGVTVLRDSAAPARRDRAAFGSSGPVAPDGDVVALERAALDRLSRSIEVAALD